MKIYLLDIGGERPVFYSEEPEVSAADAAKVASKGGVRGWLERKYRSLQTAVHESEEGVGARVRRMWQWLQRRTAADESLLRRLRVARRIELYHPATMTAEDVRETWAHYLASRRRRHVFWLTINLLIAPVTLVLAPIPGPNLIGYWFAYRAVCHALAVLGVRRAQAADDEMRLHPSVELDNALASSRDEQVARLASSLKLAGLEAFVKRVVAERGETRHAPLAVR